jgi:hypothetical protein
MEKEIVVKVKTDSYKDLQNFLNNEMKITKPDVEALIEKYVEAIVKKHLLEDGTGKFNSAIDRAIMSVIAGFSSSRPYTRYIEEKVNKVVEEAIGKKIREIVAEQLSGININIFKDDK